MFRGALVCLVEQIRRLESLLRFLLSFRLLLLAVFLVPKRSTSRLAHKSSSEFFFGSANNAKNRARIASEPPPEPEMRSEGLLRKSNPQETLGEQFSSVDKEGIRKTLASESACVTRPFYLASRLFLDSASLGQFFPFFARRKAMGNETFYGDGLIHSRILDYLICIEY